MPPVSLGKIAKYLSATIPFLCLAGIVTLQSQEYKKNARQLNYANYVRQEAEQAKVIKLQQKSPHLGFDNLVANLSYLNFIQYFGDRNARETIGYQLVPEYFATITEIDPRFTEAYLTLSIANSMYAGNPEQTVALMSEILTAVDPKSKNAALLWTSKGLDELLFLGDTVAAIDSYKVAARWANLTDSYRPDGLTVKDLESALESVSELEIKRAQIRAWSSVLVNIKNQNKKREIINKIDSLRAEILVLEETQEISN